MKTEKMVEKAIREVLGEYDLVPSEIDGITESILKKLNEEESFKDWIKRMAQMK